MESRFENHFKQSYRLFRRPLTKNILALSIPFFALILLLTFWSTLQSFAWAIFYLGLLASSLLGSFLVACLATLLSALFVWCFVISPADIFQISDLHILVFPALFVLTGLLLSVLNAYLRKSKELKEKAEKQLERQLFQLRAAESPGRFGSWVWDIKNSRLQASDEVSKIFGLSHSSNSANYETLLECVHPEDKFFLRQTFTEALVKGKPFSVNYRIVRPDGETRFIHAVAGTYFDENGKPNEMVGTLHDITDQQDSTDKLIESEKKFRGLLETAYDSIVIINEKGLIEFANYQTKLWFGYEPQELVGQSIDILVPERFRKNHTHLRASYVASPSPRTMGKLASIMALRKDGSEFPADISLTPYQSPRGTIVTAFIHDITTQKLVENQQRFLSEASRILSETTDYQERIQKITEMLVPAMADWCLVQVEEEGTLVGRGVALQTKEHPLRVVQQPEPIRLPIHYATRYLAMNIIDDDLRKISGSNDSYFNELKKMNFQTLLSAPMVARDRTVGVIWLACCEPRKFDEKDLQLAHLIAERAGIAIDNARLYQDTQKALRMREDILAIVSHDLRNPLSIIRGFNEIIASETPSESESSEIVVATQAIARSVHQMDRLINDLLDFARMEVGTFAINPQKCLIQQAIQEGIEQTLLHAKQKNISIETNLPKDLPYVECDSDRIRQVVANLVGNAIKFSPAGGSIQITSRQKRLEIEFAIKDQGPGISPQHLPHLFDRYWQAKKTAHGGGVGLGLPIAKGIVESHHGHIWVESQLGSGSTFYFTLPLSLNSATSSGPLHSPSIMKD